MLAKHALSQLSYGPVPEDECFLSRFLRARLRWRYGAAAFVQEGLPSRAAEQRRLVGLGRLELPTSRLSSARSNQLSYKPLTLLLEIKRLLEIKDRLRPKDRGIRMRASGVERRLQSHKRSAPGACSSAKKEKRRRRNPANGAQRSGDRWPLMFQKRFDRARIRRSRLAEEPSLERR